MFGRKKKLPVTVLAAPTSRLLETLSTKSGKDLAVTEWEKEFFIALESRLHLEGYVVSSFSAERMGSGSIRLHCQAGIVGTVHLRKRFGSIQYFTTPLDIHDMKDAPIEAILAVIPYWISYAAGCMKLHKAATSV